MTKFIKPFKHSADGIKVVTYSGECDAPDEVVSQAIKLGYVAEQAVKKVKSKK